MKNRRECKKFRVASYELRESDYFLFFHSQPATQNLALVPKKQTLPEYFSGSGLFIYPKPGHYLLSQAVARLLPSAHGGLAARFGMVLGVSHRSIGTQVIQKCIGLKGEGFGLLVPVGSTPLGASTTSLSRSSSRTGLMEASSWSALPA